MPVPLYTPSVVNIFIRDIYVPVTYLPVLLRVRALYLKFCFEEAIQIVNAEERTRALVTLRNRKSTKGLVIVLIASVAPNVLACVYAYANVHDVNDWKPREFDQGGRQQYL